MVKNPKAESVWVVRTSCSISPPHPKRSESPKIHISIHS
nr:MAG TPA: hypothetical protein [Caudoviricetes sp.]